MASVRINQRDAKKIEAQFAELRTQGDADKDRREWVANGHELREPGHITMHRIKENMEKAREWCWRGSFYTLGPLTTGVIAPGYDISPRAHRPRHDWLVRHGQCFAGYPKEHLGVPNKKGRQGLASLHTDGRHAR